MSIRTVSQLPLFEVRDVITKKIEDSNFRGSLLELSYLSSEGKYESKRMKLGDYYDYIYYNILSGGDGDKTTFNTIVDFTKLVSMYDGLHLSGDFLLNEDFTDDESKEYRCYVKTQTNTIYGLDRNLFISPTTTLCSDVIDLVDRNGTRYGKIASDGIELTANVHLTGDHVVNGNSTTDSLDVYEDVSCGGDVYANDVYGKMFHGVSLCARWADLAETYESDKQYPNGTLVKFGGEKEITIADHEANAVITTKPGFVLNGDRNGCQIALTGRTLVRVVGPVSKFENVYPCPFEHGVGATKSHILFKTGSFDCQKPIGKALEQNNSEAEKLVECVVHMQF